MKKVKIAVVGSQGVGKSKICEKILIEILAKKENYQDTKRFYSSNRLSNLEYNDIRNKYDLAFVPEQFREVIKDISNLTKQTEEITLATYAKQLCLENLYIAQGKNILCDRSILDTFVYYDYFNKIGLMQELNDCIKNARDYDELISTFQGALYRMYTYSKIYLIEPSDREIEDDGFRLTDKKQQFEIHKLFLEHFKSLDNVEIINQEDAHKEEFINKVVSKFII